MSCEQGSTQMLYLKSGTVVKQPANNSCLYHSLNFNLGHEDIYKDVYYEHTGFTLRKEVNYYIRDNHAKVIWITPDLPETFADAIAAISIERRKTFLGPA